MLNIQYSQNDHNSSFTQYYLKLKNNNNWVKNIFAIYRYFLNIEISKLIQIYLCTKALH